MESSADDMSVLLQFAKFSKGFRIPDFDEFVQNSIGVENLDFFGRLAYPNQWQIRLKDPVLRERLIRTGRTRIKNRSCWIYPLNQQEIRGFVHWLPNSVSNDQLKEHLQLYGNVLFVESQEKLIRDRRVESDQRYYGLILSNGTVKEDLPHFLKINGFLCLLVVRGREPACFHCKEVGHRRADCPKYKSKLISYCQRKPNTAELRLRPRGRRHAKAETDIRSETDINEVSSNNNTEVLDGEVTTCKTKPHTSSSEVLEPSVQAPGENTDSNEKLVEMDFLAEWKESLCKEGTSASFIEVQTKDILETIQHIQTRTREDLQERLKNFEKEITLIFTRGELYTCTRDHRKSLTGATCKNLEQKSRSVSELEMEAKEVYSVEKSTVSVEMAESVSSVDTEGPEIQPELPVIQQVTADTAKTINEKCEESSKDLSSTAKDSTTNAEKINPVLTMLKETKQTPPKTFKNTFNKSAEFAMGKMVAEKTSKDSIPKENSELTEEDIQELLDFLKKTQATAIRKCEEKFKEMEAGILPKPRGEGKDSEPKSTEEDIYFSKKILARTKDNSTKILRNTFKKLEEKVLNVSAQSQTVSENADGTKALNIEKSTAQDANSEKLRAKVIDCLKHTCNKYIKHSDETEKNEKASIHDENQKHIIQNKSDPVIMAQRDFEAIGICKHKKVVKKAKSIEKVSSANKEMESNISKVILENIDKLKQNIKNVFDSAYFRSSINPEIEAIFKQVESEVMKIVEGTKNRWETCIEDILASFYVDIV